MTLSLSVLSGAPQPASEDSSLLSPLGGSRRQTADLQELQALLNDEQATSPNGAHGTDGTDGPSTSTAGAAGDKTVRLSRVQALLEASNSVSESPSAMDAEETVALQDLLQVSQQVEPSSDSSMSISRDSDATGSARASESRRATLGLGEVQARLMQELNDFERRSSIFTRPLSQASRASRASQTTATVTGSTAGTTGNTGTEAAGGLLGLLEAEQDSTLELQQYAEALRRERAEALAARPSEPSEATEATDEILKKMRLSTSAARVEEFDATVTEDLRRLSQLLEPARAGVEEDSLEGGEEKAHAPQRFSPLVTRSGSKQVIHSVKSNQKYAGGAEEQLRVIDSVTPRKLFQDPPDADEPAQTVPVAQAVPATQTAQITSGTQTAQITSGTQTAQITSGTQTTPTTQTAQTPAGPQTTEKAGEPAREKEVETSLNLDQYFLPSKTQSSLDASSIVSASLQLSSESISVEPAESAEPAKPADAIPPTPHTPRIPEPTLSPIRAPTSTIPEPSLSPIDPPAKAVKEPSLSPVVLGRFIHP